MIFYNIENDLNRDEFRTVLINSTLGERRPVDDLERMEQMVKSAGLIITARDNGKLVGVARALTDFVYCTYLSDLAVDKDYQNRGVGKELIKQIKLKTPKAKLILLAAPKAINYYPKIGMTRHDNCYFLDNIEELK